MTKTALLLTAGKATRLGELRNRWAKACVPVAGTSPLAFLLPRLKLAGITDVWLNLHWKPEQVREVAETHAHGLQLHFLEEPELLGTGGTLLEVSHRWGAVPDLVINAKIFTDYNCADLLLEPPSTLVLHTKSSLETFGGFQVDEHQRLLALRPKGPPAYEPHAGVFTGICRPALSWVEQLQQYQAKWPAELLCIVRHAVLPLMEQNHAPRGLLHSGFWCEISTQKRIKKAADMIRSKTY
ncbi:MAG: hypothetical protein OTJ44_02590 [Planctomycetota bacterium]|nr:hypothetical protein [Planctomycetota bacterium]